MLPQDRIPMLPMNSDVAQEPDVVEPTIAGGEVTVISQAQKQRALQFVAQATSMVVSNPAEYEVALLAQSDIRALKDHIESRTERIIRGIRTWLDERYADKREAIKPLDEADKTIGAKAQAWKQAEDERTEKERQRLQAEADAKARADADAEAKRKDKEAEKLRKAGDAKAAKEREREAESLRTAPISAPSVSIASRVPDVAGMTAGDNWAADENIDIKLLAEAVYKGWCVSNAISPNTKFLNQQAKAMKPDRAGQPNGLNVIDPKTKRTPFPGVKAINKGTSRRT